MEATSLQVQYLYFHTLFEQFSHMPLKIKVTFIHNFTKFIFHYAKKLSQYVIIAHDDMSTNKAPWHNRNDPIFTCCCCCPLKNTINILYLPCVHLNCEGTLYTLLQYLNHGKRSSFLSSLLNHNLDSTTVTLQLYFASCL